MDQGSEGWCPAVFLQNHLKVNMWIFFDTPHRAWNDVRGAIVEAELWDVVMRWQLPFAVNYGPWEEARWWRKAQDAADEGILARSPPLVLCVVGPAGPSMAMAPKPRQR